MTSIVIPYRITNHTKELLYCLRSIENYLQGVGDIFIIGDLPEWIVNVIHIPYQDNPDWRFKEKNIYEKTLAACNDERVSNPFLFMNDDHYLMAKSDASEWPYLYTNNYPTSGKYFETTMFNTWGAIGDITYFDIHCPILLHKNEYRNTVGKLDWSKPYGYCIKSVYCQDLIGSALNEPLECNDNKLRLPYEMPLPCDFFSTSDKSFTEPIMRDLYPNKSKYER
ncbi:MAG TPA: hypothetical protein VHL77_02115 [Ferruginibacter sp.]|jgi:hypothetical protein|nr:hypothetical protein [Ferruginibacter sp.]